MRGKYRPHHILGVVLLFIWASGCGSASPDPGGAVESRTQSVSSSLKPAFLDTKPDLILTGPTESYTQYGNYPRFGDVNGDGYEDLLVAGASRYNNSQGRLYLYYGGKNMDDKPDKIFTGEKAGDKFGEEAYLADVNGDNYADVVTGSPTFNDWQGRTYIFYGGPDMDANADLIIDGEPGTQGRFGNTITAGDVNNDGYADVVVSAIYFNNRTGRAYLFYGGDPMDTTIDLTFDGENENDRFGRDINNPKMVGDVNGDGYDDLLISTRTWNFWEGVVGQGRVWIYYNKPLGSTDEPPISLQEATSAGEVDEVKALISKGVDVNAKEWGSLRTALHYAAEKGHKKVVEMLLAKDASTDARDALSTTPLHYAVEKRHKEVVELLIAKGADANVKDYKGRVPLWYAKRKGYTEIIELLRKHGAKE